MLAITRVGGYPRATVPREVRELLGVSVSSGIEWIFEDGGGC